MQHSDDIDTLTILGMGFMGQGIARAAIRAGFRTLILHDTNKAMLDNAYKGIRQHLEILQSNNEIKDNLTLTVLKEPDLKASVENADFVIEAIPEIKELKQQVFHLLAQHAPPSCVLATNTSTIIIDDIALSSHCKDRIIGMHFFVPEESRLIEIGKGSYTADGTLRKTIAVGEKLPCENGSRIIVVLDRPSPGFIVNRSTAPVVAYLNWIMDRADEKEIKAQQIDAEIEPLMQGFFKTMDFVGLDVAYQSCKSFAETLSPDLGPGRVLTDLVRQGHLGMKTGKGFYNYSGNGEPLIERGFPNHSSENRWIDLELLMAIQFNECCRIVEERILPDFKRIDEYIFAAICRPGPCSSGFEHYRKWCTLLDGHAQKSGMPYFLPCDLMQSGDFER